MPYPRAIRIAAAAALAICTSLAAGRAHAASPPALHYAVTAWTSDKGLPGDVFAITQDSDGYLWLGTPTGLLRFDGSTFTPWPVDRSALLPAGPVHALVGSPDGSIWVGYGGGGGVVRIRHGEIVRFSPSDGAPPGVTDMIQDRRGTIWVATRRGLYRFADERWTQLGPAAGFDAADAFSLHEDRAGRLWVATGRGIYQRAADAFELFDAEPTAVQSVTSDQSGAIWITDSDEIVARLSTHDPVSLAPDIRLPSAAWRVMRDRRGQIWVAAFGGGLMRIGNPTDPTPLVERFEYEHRLPGSPRSLYEDREGNIWVGMRGGLLRLSESSFRNVAPLEGLTNEGVRTAAVGKDGSVWVATGHGLTRFAASGRTAYRVSQTMALHVDRHGVLWVATSQQLGRWLDGRMAPVALPDAVRASRVMAMTTDGDATLWLCTSLRGVMAWDGAELRQFHRHPEIANRSCQSIFTDSHDRVWIGFLSGGAAVYDKGSIQRLGVEEGLAPGTVLAMVEDRSGAIWLSTSTGVTRYKNGRLTSITRANAPLADLVPVLVEDEEGYIWVGVHSGAGVLRFHPGEVDKVAGNAAHQLEYALYDESDGMQHGSQTWQSGVGGVRGGDGRLWVATGLGMTVIDPAELPPVRRPSPPRIHEVIADGRRVTPDRAVALAAGTSTLRIEYGAVSLSSASKLRFRYMLEGIDDDWVYAGRTREAAYARVPPGEHRFRVSTTQDGRWSEAGVWSFSIAPPFYRTQSFLLLAVAAFGLTLALAWWLRLRAVRHQYAMVFAERARMSREIHDTLLQSLAAIGVELETIASQLDPAHDPARDGLRRLRRQVGHCLREARESILELRRNTVLKPRALIDSLRELAANTTRTKGTKTEFSWSGPPRQCSSETEMQLFRISQEAINNAIRHGRAGRVLITLSYAKDQVVLTVADDGCGFTPDEQDSASGSGEHLGLLTMRERAARVRGRLAIVSSPGNGTTIHTTIPLAD
jgi:signal transduction histidine kinase/ligand-binding sensor domain-containing protein